MAKQEVLEARHPDYTPNKLFKENCEDIHCKENIRVKSLTLPAANTAAVTTVVTVYILGSFSSPVPTFLLLLLLSRFSRVRLCVTP